MKKNLIKSIVFSILIVFSISLTITGQRNPSHEILVYFSNGILRGKFSEDKSIRYANITDYNFIKLLEKHSINEGSIESVFPFFDEKDTLVNYNDGLVVKNVNLAKIFRMLIPEDQNIEEIISELKQLSNVIYAERNGFLVKDVVPNDEYYDLQWSLKNGASGCDIHIEDAWEIYKGNASNKIGIIDDGVDHTHPDFSGKISGDTYWGTGHGMLVAGIAGARTDNYEGIAGIDWYAQIHSQYYGEDDGDVAQAIYDAINYSTWLRVINTSWDLWYYEQGLPVRPGRYSTTVRAALAYAYKMDRVCVSAMGNWREDWPDVDCYPAAFGQGIIAVGATDQDDYYAPFSNAGNHIDVVAPGVDIISTTRYGNWYGNDPNYDIDHGTSYSAPIVTGIVSLLKGYKSNLSNDDIEHIIQLSADKVPGMGQNEFTEDYGYGRVNARTALDLIKDNVLRQWSASGGTSVSNTGYYVLQFLGASGLADGNYIVKRHEVRKTVNFPSSFCSLVDAWGRGVFTNGWSQESPNYGMGYTEVVPGTLTNSSVELRTYVYQVWNTAWQYQGYKPCTPSQVTFQYSVLGIPMEGIITGDNLICTSNKTYTLSSIPPNSTVSWAFNPGYLVTPYSGNGSTATVHGSCSYLGKGKITFTITPDGCSSYQVKKENIIVIGPDQTEVDLDIYYSSGEPAPKPSGVYLLCPNTTYHIYLMNSSNCSTSNYIWTIPSGWTKWYQNNNMISINTNSQPGGQIMVDATTCCTGCSSLRILIDYVGQYWACGGGGYFMASPNPADSYLDIDINKREMTTDGESVTNEYVLTMVDKMGTIKYTDEFKEFPYRINIKEMPEGLYIINLNYDGKISSIKVVIEH